MSKIRKSARGQECQVRLAFAEGVMRTQQILADKGLLEEA